MAAFPDNSCSKIITYKDLNVQIINNGKSVQLVKGNQELKVILNESDASQENQKHITLNPDDVILEPQYHLKYICDSQQNTNTKVLFFKNHQGIAIKWSTGLQSKFTFTIDE
ncbi:unnamed protein product [Paramecium octaurelia]|uniref:Uncharacterized protein n=1 Tax=Paramecium octaurelia TaxID=43137 RepID=A0A8S1YLY8_PAROT|nr:unnamed protein product [Paramecium octaurelia]